MACLGDKYCLACGKTSTSKPPQSSAWTWFGATIALNTSNPVVVVPSGSMCIPYGGACTYHLWDHPFDRTLHVGDLLVLQGLPPKDYNAAYPNSDIIVFHEAANPTILTVHRIAAASDINGTRYFHTKGDGNGIKWPAPVTPRAV